MPGHQKTRFREKEGDAWFDRNQMSLDSMQPKEDPVIKMLDQIKAPIQQVLEVGCANGWRIEAIRQKWHAKCFGAEPSLSAIKNAKTSFPLIEVKQATADTLPFASEQFDVTILGFFLYVCDREDLFRVAAETDRVTRNGGHILVYDFYSPKPVRSVYSHQPDLSSYKMDYSTMFTWNPAYTEISRSSHQHRGHGSKPTQTDRVDVILLKKESNTAYPLDF